jgi:hypothetical protein
LKPRIDTLRLSTKKVLLRPISEQQNSLSFNKRIAQPMEQDIHRGIYNRNDPDLVQAFLKKWWVESDFNAPNLPLSLRFKGSGCHYNRI